MYFTHFLVSYKRCLSMMMLLFDHNLFRQKNSTRLPFMGRKSNNYLLLAMVVVVGKTLKPIWVQHIYPHSLHHLRLASSIFRHGIRQNLRGKVVATSKLHKLKTRNFTTIKIIWIVMERRDGHESFLLN